MYVFVRIEAYALRYTTVILYTYILPIVAVCPTNTYSWKSLCPWHGFNKLNLHGSAFCTLWSRRCTVGIKQSSPVMPWMFTQGFQEYSFKSSPCLYMGRKWFIIVTVSNRNLMKMMVGQWSAHEEQISCLLEMWHNNLVNWISNIDVGLSPYAWYFIQAQWYYNQRCCFQ